LVGLVIVFLYGSFSLVLWDIYLAFTIHKYLLNLIIIFFLLFILFEIIYEMLIIIILISLSFNFFIF